MEISTVSPFIDPELWATLSDEEIVSRVRAGHTALYEILMRRHNQRLYRAARSAVRDEAEAEDIIQETFVRAYTHLHQFAGQARFSTWITRIAMHEAFFRLRQRDRWEQPHPDMEPASQTASSSNTATPNPERQAFQTELRAVLQHAIDALSVPYRAVFVLREVEGMSTADVAECLDISEETAKVRLRRARRLLRRQLYKETGAASMQAFVLHRPRCDRVVLGVLQRIRVECAAT